MKYEVHVYNKLIDHNTVYFMNFTDTNKLLVYLMTTAKDLIWGTITCTSESILITKSYTDAPVLVSPAFDN